MRIFFWGLLYLTSSLYAQAGQNCVKAAKEKNGIKNQGKSDSASPSNSGSSSPSNKGEDAPLVKERTVIRPVKVQIDQLSPKQGVGAVFTSILKTLSLDSGKAKPKDHALVREAYLFWKTIFSMPDLSKKLSFFKTQNFSALSLSKAEKTGPAYFYQQSKNNILLSYLKDTDTDQNLEKMLKISWNISDLLYNKKEQEFFQEATFCNFVFDVAKTLKDKKAIQKVMAVSRNSEKFFTNLKLLERSFPPIEKEFLMPFLKSEGVKDLRTTLGFENTPLEEAGLGILTFLKQECYQELYRMLSDVLDQKLALCLKDDNLSGDRDASDAVALYAYHGIQKCNVLGVTAPENALKLYEEISEKTKDAFFKLKNPNKNLALFLGDIFSFGTPMRSQWMKDHGDYQFYDYPSKNFLLNTIENFYYTFGFYQYAAEHSENQAALFEIISRKLIYFPENSEEEEFQMFEEVMTVIAKENQYKEAIRILFDIYFELPKEDLDPSFSIPAYQKLVFELKNRHGIADLCLNSLFQDQIEPKKNFETAVEYLRLGCQQEDFMSQFIWAYLSRYGFIPQQEEDPVWIDVFMKLGHQEHTLALDWIKENEKIDELLLPNSTLDEYTHQIMKEYLEKLSTASESRSFRSYLPLTQYQKKVAQIYLDTFRIFENEIRKKDKAYSMQESVKTKEGKGMKSSAVTSMERKETLDSISLKKEGLDSH